MAAASPPCYIPGRAPRLPQSRSSGHTKRQTHPNCSQPAAQVGLSPGLGDMDLRETRRLTPYPLTLNTGTVLEIFKYTSNPMWEITTPFNPSSGEARGSQGLRMLKRQQTVGMKDMEPERPRFKR